MKKISILASLGLTILASSAFINSAKADVVLDKNSESKDLIGQLGGHETYKNEAQMSWDQYMIGRVIGKAGNILFVKLPDGKSFQAGGDVPPGCDVLVQMVDGRYEVAGIAHSGWISRLQSDYGWKQVTAMGSLNERTAAIWSELQTSSTTVSAPPRTTTAPSYTPVENPVMDSPVRGLW